MLFITADHRYTNTTRTNHLHHLDFGGDVKQSQLFPPAGYLTQSYGCDPTALMIFQLPMARQPFFNS